MHQMFIYLAIAREEYGQENFPNRSGNDCSKDKSLTGRSNLILPSIVIITISGHQIPINPIFTARKRSLRRLCFYTCLSVILFTSGGGAKYLGRYPLAGTLPPSPQAGPPPAAGTPRSRYNPPGRYTPPSRYTPTPWQVHPLAGTHPPGRYTPHLCMLGYGQQAGGTHPNGMHSCFKGVHALLLKFSGCFRRKYPIKLNCCLFCKLMPGERQMHSGFYTGFLHAGYF